MLNHVVDITKTTSWAELNKQSKAIADERISSFLAENSARAKEWTLECAGVFLDYSKNLADEKVLATLLSLVDESALSEHREAMFSGEAINTSENRAVLHTALRANADQLVTDGLGPVADEVHQQQMRIKEVSEKLRSQQWLGSTGKPITDVINIGIGGSDLGPKMVCEALKEFQLPSIRCHFISNVDGEVILSLLKTLNAETTLVVVSSKTFTTQETLLNAQTAMTWFREQLGLSEPFASKHVIGVTATPENAKKLGLPDEHILQFGSWVGGRYSLWSSIGLSIAIAVGYEQFESLLAGAKEMDKHFREAPAGQNMPVLLALLGIWYTNFLNAESHAVIPYCERLVELPLYLQQLDMESNGKSVTQDGRAVNHATGPIIWGATGTNGQHSFFQLLHQGSHFIPVDFIAVVKDGMSAPEHHRVLLANMLAQSSALMSGKHSEEPCRNYPGNKPSNVILLEQLDAKTLGALIALYEHKVFVQGSLWGLNSFDQWGVELGKVLTKALLDGTMPASELDSSTQQLMERVSL